jgi:2-alkyl-3-oxoalkanoate reductase
VKVLVTGGAGFLGKAICQAMLLRGYQVRSFQRNFSKELEALDVEQICGDLGNADDVLRACSDVHAVFHNAAKAGAWGSYQSYYDVNVRGTQHILAACQTQGIGKLIYTSTPSVAHNGRVPCEGGNEQNTPYGEHFKAHYPQTKKIAEQLVLAANSETLSTLALRPRLIWGPGDNNLLPNIALRARQGRLRFIDGGNNKLDTTYIDNAAAAHVAAFDHLTPGNACAGKAYFISNGEPMPVKHVVNSLLKAAGVAPVERSAPFALAYTAGAVCEALWSVLPLKNDPPMTRFLAEQLSTPHWYDISAAQRDFGYTPSISFDQGIARLTQWWLTRNSR